MHEEMGLEGGVRLLGMRRDVRRLMSASDIFCLTSAWEGFPNALVEGMAGGLPVVTTAFAGIEEVIGGGDVAVTVPLDDDAAMAREILALVADPAPRYAGCGRTRQRRRAYLMVQAREFDRGAVRRIPRRRPVRQGRATPHPERAMRRAAEKIADIAAAILTLPAWAFYGILVLLTGRLHACQSIGQRASRWPGDGGIVLRRALLERVLAKVGPEAVIGFGSLISKPTAELGRRAYIGAYCVLGDVRIGDNTMIADHVVIPSGSGQHGTSRLDIPMRDQKGEFRTITLGTDSWIGSHSVILADVGSHAIVGAGSVVTKPVPDYAIVVGNPARQIGDRRDTAAGAGGEPREAAYKVPGPTDPPDSTEDSP